ncbi:tetratricopeptide repeat protein [Spiribacter sp. C176]|uniref:Tetratricopeptide repeat protein n=1 Tax=Spiribacter salilacus TaxID=2664894 RepID=A0A6N7QQ11_9GAMM|nr:tetratricopeptide repeat protein [Spiribacter salilacus]MRH78625.1 tetratricopeptide repeat protein [Spiribacter salilacus]
MERFCPAGYLKWLTLCGIVLLTGCASSSLSESDSRALAADLRWVESEDLSPISDDALLTKILLAEMALARGQTNTAIESYATAAAQSEDVQVVRRAVEVALREDDYEVAMAATKRWLSLAPDSVDARQLLGVLTIQQGNLEGAYSILSQNLPAEQSERDALIGRLGSLLMQPNMPDEALALMQRLAAEQPSSAAAQLALARLALSREALSIAREAVEQALSLRPDWVTARLVRVDVLLMQEQSALALAAYRSLIEDGVSSSEIMTNAAMLAMQAGDLRYAGQLLRALKKQPGQADQANFWLGQLAEQGAVWTEALRYYRNVRGLLQGEAMMRIAWILARQERFDQAYEELSAVRSEHPELAASAWRSEGEMLRMQDEPGAALQVFNAALLAHPDDLDLRYSRALVLVMLDAVEPAIEALEEILAVDPNNPAALNALGYTLVDQTDRIDEGAAMIERAYEAAPDDPAVIDSMGWAAFRQGDPERALSYLERAYALASDDPEISAHLGEVLWVLGQRARAREIWAPVLVTHPDHPVLRETTQRLDP